MDIVQLAESISVSKRCRPPGSPLFRFSPISLPNELRRWFFVYYYAPFHQLICQCPRISRYLLSRIYWYYAGERCGYDDIAQSSALMKDIAGPPSATGPPALRKWNVGFKMMSFYELLFGDIHADYIGFILYWLLCMSSKYLYYFTV